MLRPTKLSDYPWVVIRLDCVLCERRGCYRLARLAARYGPEQSLDGLLADLAHNCPWWRTNPRRYEPRCGARFVDIEHNLPPPDDPLHRQREIAREDLPRRRSSGAGWSGVVPTLSSWALPMLIVSCRRCGRRDCYITADLFMNMGDARLTDLLVRLTADCPRRKETGIYELCQASYEVP